MKPDSSPSAKTNPTRLPTSTSVPTPLTRPFLTQVRLSGANKTLLTSPTTLQQFQVGFACGANQPIDNVFIQNITDSNTHAAIPYNTTTYRASGNVTCSGTRQLGLARTLQALASVDLTILVLNPSANLSALTPAELQANLIPLLQSVVSSLGSSGFTLVAPDNSNTGSTVVSGSNESSSSLLVNVLVPIATVTVLSMIAVMIAIHIRRTQANRTPTTRTIYFESDELQPKERVSRSESVRVMLSPLQIRV